MILLGSLYSSLFTVKKLPRALSHCEKDGRLYDTTLTLDMRWFPTGVARHPQGATQWYRLLLLAAYGLAAVLP